MLFNQNCRPSFFFVKKLKKIDGRLKGVLTKNKLNLKCASMWIDTEDLEFTKQLQMARKEKQMKGNKNEKSMLYFIGHWRQGQSNLVILI